MMMETAYAIELLELMYTAALNGDTQRIRSLNEEYSRNCVSSEGLESNDLDFCRQCLYLPTLETFSVNGNRERALSDARRILDGLKLNGSYEK